MGRKRCRPEGSTELRERAERRASDLPEPFGPPSMAEAQKAVHELQVHRIELEMQNEELRRARLETEAALERYMALFDFAPIGYVCLDQRETIREVNHAAARLLGMERGAMVGMRIRWLVAAHDLGAVVGLLGRAPRSGFSESCEVEMVGKRPPALAVRLTATVHTGASGEPKILLALEDIRERRAREDAFLATQRALREANQRKDVFLAVLSHELRNPLAPIKNSLYVLERAEPDAEAAHRARTIIERQVAHLARLVDNLVDVSRMTQGKIHLQREQVDLAALVRGAIEDHRTSFEANGVRLEARIESARCPVFANPARLVQALTNVLGNARKFTPHGGTVTVTLRCEGERAALSVRDTGMGIPPDMLAHVFEPFAQGPQASDRARGGLGLGLAMVKGLVELHGGVVGIHSEGPGRGTEVKLWLPLHAEGRAPAGAAEVAPIAGRRILVIDDNADSAETLRDALAFSGHDVRTALDGPSGLAMARDFRPEIVICDIGLPQMDGCDVARAFRADEALRGARLVALSGYAQPEDRRRAFEAGFNEYVVKPPSFELLERLVTEPPQPKPNGELSTDEQMHALLH